MTKEAANIVNDFDYVGDEKKIKEVIGDNLEMYKEFYGSDPVDPMSSIKK
jgi:hypothetical protein